MGTATANVADLLNRAESATAVATAVLLAWLAQSDGDYAGDEDETLRTICGKLSDSTDLVAAIAIGRRGDTADIELVCHVVERLPIDLKHLLLHMALLISLADGRLVTTENHVLRFLADVLGIGVEALDQLFENMTGARLPTPIDPSSLHWWEQKQHHRQEQSRQRQQQTSNVSARVRHLATLGLDEGATADDIKESYRRLALVHHPDHFSRLGAAAIEAATLSFSRINEAYAYLSRT